MTTDAANAATEPLNALIHQMGDLLGSVIETLDGPATLALEESIRKLAKDSRAGEAQAAEHLRDIVAHLDANDAYEMAMAFTTYFELVNLCEEAHRTSKLRTYSAERAAGLRERPVRESIEAAVMELKQHGVTRAELQAMLDRMSIELVFTAHPTESKRRTVLGKLRRLGRCSKMTNGECRMTNRSHSTLDTRHSTLRFAARSPHCG